jgi:hypothetical protein
MSCLQQEGEMRRKVKRRLFLMSMALATGASYSAFAKGAGKSADAHFYGDERLSAHVTSLPVGEIGETETRPPLLFGKLKKLFGGLNLAPDSAPPSAAREWRLEMFSPDARSDLANDSRPERAKPIGIALRLQF